MKRILVFGMTLLMLAFSADLTAQWIKKNKKKGDETEAKTKKKSDGLKSYGELIDKETQSDSGLFIVHQKQEDYYFEIPFDHLEKDLLLVSRIAKIPAGLGGGYVNAGSKTNQQVVQWSRAGKKILLRSISYTNVADENLPIHQSVEVNNYAPIIAAFSIEAFNEDSSSAVIKVNDLFLKDVKALSGLPDRYRKSYKVKGLDQSRSFISRMQAYPENIEVRHDMTYNASEPPSDSRSGTISMQMSQSLYLLPEEPMQARLYDERVGWFTFSQIDFGSEELKADEKRYLRRWRLEPKDPEAYANGELVEPIKPIVYYLDPATPEKWRPYIKQGIEDWQIAFEEAGFKNAIIAKDAPTKEEDPDWSAEDARYSTIRYVATTTRNAMGPSVSDPRSGEIIESDIVWYHNHLRSYRNRYLLETGAANPRARTLDTPMEDIGEMVRMVIAHEVGHALGLPHNMKASYAYPTDSLRSASFTNQWGLATTIMDYTRYNYVAQPGDSGVRWIRMLGPYDLYAINWGYRYLPEASSPEDEVASLNQWIEAHEGDPKYLFGARNSFDPSSQTESVGDDLVKASTYGLNNLKIVAENLFEWTTKPDESYDDLKELYGELTYVWGNYVRHVTTVIGGVYEELLTSDQAGMRYTHIEKAEQKRAMRFLNEEVFSSPEWLLQDEILMNIGSSGSVERLQKMQSRFLTALLSESRLQRVLENESMNDKAAYSLTEMLSDLRYGLWSELATNSALDIYRRSLQRRHVELLGKLAKAEEIAVGDVQAAARAELRSIQAMTKRSANLYSGLDKNHLLAMSDLSKHYLNWEKD
jgi:hypothetical protein